MPADLAALTIILSIVWSLIYWVGGGVLFAVLALLRLGRVRKARFSCMFSLVAFACGIGAAHYGVRLSQEAFEQCAVEATMSRAQTFVALLGCGMGGVVIAFSLGAVVLTLGGMLALLLSRTGTKTWHKIDPAGVDNHEKIG